MRERNEKLKVAIIIDSYTRGGVSVVLQVLLERLAKEDLYDITMFARDYEASLVRPVPDSVIRRPWGERMTVSGAFRQGFRTGCAFLRDSFLSLWHFRNCFKQVLYSARCRAHLPGEFDCAIAYQMIPNDVTITALEKINAKRKILWLHGKKRFIEKDLPFYDALYSKADAIVCVSKDTEDHFRQLMPRSADKALTIHNMYNIPVILSKAQEAADEMDLSSGSIKLVTAARLAAQKGYERVPGAARKLKDAGYDFHWYIIGDGELRSEIEAALKAEGVADRVHLLGHKDNPYPYIRQCDIYVQTSHMEGFCTSTMEAKILHKPVVTTDVQGMREQFVSGESGLIVESSVDGIFAGIQKMIDSPELREKIIENLRAQTPHNDRVLALTRAVIEGAQK